MLLLAYARVDLSFSVDVRGCSVRTTQQTRRHLSEVYLAFRKVGGALAGKLTNASTVAGHQAAKLDDRAGFGPQGNYDKAHRAIPSDISTSRSSPETVS